MVGGTVGCLAHVHISWLVMLKLRDRSVSQVADADALFESFLANCFDAPDLCPLAARADSPEQLITKMYELFDTIKAEPVVFGEYGLQTYALMKLQLFGQLYAPPQYPMLASYLDSLLTRNKTSYAAYLEASLPSDEPKVQPFPDIAATGGQENIPGIRCSDEELRLDDLAAAKSFAEEWFAESEVLGEAAVVWQGLVCRQWPFMAKERYTGGFEGIETKNPLLIVANNYDPITSKEGARKTNEAFVGSRLLINDGHGVRETSFLRHPPYLMCHHSTDYCPSRRYALWGPFETTSTMACFQTRVLFVHPACLRSRTRRLRKCMHRLARLAGAYWKACQVVGRTKQTPSRYIIM